MGRSKQNKQTRQSNQSEEPKQSKNISFERKLLNDGEKNPKYVDVLDEDKPISGQKFLCASFLSPEKILKKKEIFFFEEFLKKWEFNKSMEKFLQFVNFVSFKYNIPFEDLNKDLKDFVQEEKENLIKSTLDDDYKTFLDNHEDELQQKFDIEHNFQTSGRGLKIRGVYPTLEEAELRCKMLREIDPAHDIMTGPIGVWMPWDPEAYKTGRVEYMEEELNQLMHEKLKNEANAKTAFEQRVKETKQNAIEDNIKKAEKSGNTLSQTIDENGNLIGVNNANTQEFALNEQENVSNADICKELFEGENIVVGKSDYGQSQLKSGPFSDNNNKE
jgi:hypothetical protein